MEIELSFGEIEKAMLEYGLKAPVVIAVNDENKDSNKLIGFYLSNGKNEVNIDEFRKYLTKTLPHYAIPQVFQECKEYPTSSSGKLDENALAGLVENSPTGKKDILLPNTILEQQIYDILKKYINSELSTNDDLRNMIDSLTVIDIYIDLINHKLITFEDMNTQEVSDYYTIKLLADRIEKGIQVDMVKEICGMDIEDLESMKVMNKLYDPDLSGVLLTGGTGFLGSHILHNLIKDKSVKKIYCLARSKDGASGPERLVSTYQQYFDEDISNLIGGKIVPFEGNIASEYFNITPELYDELSNNITTVINTAANVRHLGNRAKIYNDNVATVQSLIKFCVKNNITLAHMSTTSIAGSSNSAPENFDENSFFENKQNIHGSAYLETKAMAEFKILEAMEKEGLNAKIFRLGNLMPRFSDGKFQLNDDENAFITRLKAFSKLGAVPADYLSSQEIELSPIDFCSEAILKLLKTGYDQTVYHVLNSTKLSLSKVVERLEPKIVSTEEFKRRIIESKDKDVKFLMNYMHIIGANENKIMSDITASKLQALGFNWNKYDIGYIKKILQLVKEDQDLKVLLNGEKNIVTNKDVEEKFYIMEDL